MDRTGKKKPLLLEPFCLELELPIFLWPRITSLKVVLFFIHFLKYIKKLANVLNAEVFGDEVQQFETACHFELEVMKILSAFCFA